MEPTPPTIRVLVLLCIGLAAALFAGCQNPAHSDLIARERRRQEDQIYALQDYLAEYQQLLCQYRAENAALKEELGRQGSDEQSESSAPASRRGVAPRSPSPPRSTPERNNDLPAVPGLDVPPLSVPDLRDGAGREDSAFTLTGLVGGLERGGRVEQGPARRLWLSGEIVANSAGGPRILVDVVPLTDAGRSTDYAGPVSLMILSPTADGVPHSLARWDFSPEETLAARDLAPDGHAMRFRLELPEDAAVPGPVELWARIVPESSEKLLTKVPLDLLVPRSFASAPFEASPAAGAAAAAPPGLPVDRVEDPYVDTAPHPMGQDGWAIARPGEAARQTGQAPAVSRWRAATEPLPLAIAASPIASPTTGKSGRISELKKSPERTMPGWSPERSFGVNAVDGMSESLASASEQALHDWSPTR